MTLETNQEVRFVTSVYGKKYGGMLLALLYSIYTSNPKAKATIFWSDVTQSTRLLEKVFPQFDFIDIDHPVRGTFINRIAHKTVLWAEAARQCVGENLVFVDVDMLVRKDIYPFFKEPFDIAFTCKDGEIYPINTGTFLARSSNAVIQFFELWERETKKITEDDVLRRRATNHDFPYGAPDQMAFYEMIKYEQGKRQYRVRVGEEALTCVGFPCEILNETNSVPITEDVAILHYKGGWHDILLKGRNFTFRRTKEKSWEMYIFYIRTYQDAVRYVRKILNRSFSMRAFGIKRHIYLSEDLQEAPFLGYLFNLFEKSVTPVRMLYDRIHRKLSL